MDRLVAALANRQYGVVSHAQLCDIGLSNSAIGRRVGSGRFHRLHVGVYAIGHSVLGPRGRWMAAVLACGSSAALSHTSAAALWAIRPSDATLVDVTVPGTAARKRPGLRIHRSRSLGPGEVTTRDDIPVTTPARTILDLAARLGERDLHRALDRAEILELTDYPTLDALARARAGHGGAGKLRQALRDHTAGTTLTRSELEERFLALCREQALPAPRVNARVAGLEVDFVFPSARLVVETDGWQYHRTRQAFERDRRRDAALMLAGYRTLRFTHRQIAADAHMVARTVAAAVAQARAA